MDDANQERGWHPIMRNPQQQANIFGWKRLLGLVHSLRCEECGDVCDTISPLCCKRVCKACVASNSAYSVICQACVLSEFQMDTSDTDELPSFEVSTDANQFLRIYDRAQVLRMAAKRGLVPTGRTWIECYPNRAGLIHFGYCVAHIPSPHLSAFRQGVGYVKLLQFCCFKSHCSYIVS